LIKVNRIMRASFVEAWIAWQPAELEEIEGVKHRMLDLLPVLLWMGETKSALDGSHSREPIRC
jgi:hypothetical protein